MMQANDATPMYTYNWASYAAAAAYRTEQRIFSSGGATVLIGLFANVPKSNCIPALDCLLGPLAAIFSCWRILYTYQSFLYLKRWQCEVLQHDNGSPPFLLCM